GDPETKVILPRIEGDVLPLLAAAAAGGLTAPDVVATDDAAVTVVLTGDGYPAENDSGTPIDGIADAEAAGALGFHAGTARHDERANPQRHRPRGERRRGARARLRRV